MRSSSWYMILPAPEIQVTYFAVTHLAFGQTYCFATG